MSEDSRTHKSFKNAQVALIIYLIEIGITFVSRKAFIEYLSSELLGLNTVATNLLGFLNLAEMGIGTAVAFSLYKPLAENNRSVINDIVSIQGYLYRKIAIFISFVSLILLFFFPLIFQSEDLTSWYPYATFGVFLFGSLLGYLYNYRQILLSANMREYKVSLTVKGMRILKSIIQIFCIIYTQYGYELWLIIEFLNSILTSIILNKVIKFNYPWLKTDVKNGKNLIPQYKTLVTKTKQIFFHKSAGFVLDHMGPLFIFYYFSLEMVADYGNYMLIMSGASILMLNMFRGTGAAVGNLVAKESKERIYTIFKELFVSRFWLSSILAYLLYKCCSDLIVLWIGESHLFGNSTLIIMTIIAFIMMVRTTIENYIEAFGLYHDIWAPIAEMIINIGLSFLLGYFFGLNGILMGILLSLLSIVILWKPYFLFSRGLKRSVSGFAFIFCKSALLSGVAILICEGILFYIPTKTEPSIFNFALNSLIWVALFGSIITLLYLMFLAPMRAFYQRIKSIVLQKIKS